MEVINAKKQLSIQKSRTLIQPEVAHQVHLLSSHLLESGFGHGPKNNLTKETTLWTIMPEDHLFYCDDMPCWI